MNWETEGNRQERASRQAEELVEDLGFAQPPIDPLEIVAGEKPLLVAKGGDLGDLFDGQLEYHRSRGLFVLFFNTKYDTEAGRHHPRTRFSLGHELGHFYVAEHREYLESGGQSHRSRSELFVDASIEREADAFAAGLLLPRQLLLPKLCGRELTLRALDEVVAEFDTSRVATALRCVELTDQPCAVFAIRGGQVAWRRVSRMALRAGCYPRKGRGLRSPGAQEEWFSFLRGEGEERDKEASLSAWFETYERGSIDEVVVTEQYVPISTMGTLLVLVTMDEDDVFPG